MRGRTIAMVVISAGLSAASFAEDLALNDEAITGMVKGKRLSAIGPGASFPQHISGENSGNESRLRRSAKSVGV